MKKKLVSKSAFFNPRFITGFALCSFGVFLTLLVFAHPNQPDARQTAPPQQSMPTVVGVALPAAPDAVSSKAPIKTVDGDYAVDLGALGVHPAKAPLPLRTLASGEAASPEGSAMG